MAALKAIDEQGMSINAAAHQFGVSRRTLQRLVAGDADEDTVVPKRGAPTFLPPQVEKMLAEHLKRAAENRVGVAPSRLPHYARVMARYLKINLGKWKGGITWRRDFKKRWGLSTRKTGQTTGARIRNFNHVTAASWFQTMGPTIAQFKGPEILNVDDTSFNPEESLGYVSALWVSHATLSVSAQPLLYLSQYIPLFLLLILSPDHRRKGWTPAKKGGCEDRAHCRHHDRACRGQDVPYSVDFFRYRE